ncbi:acyl-ACP--UDP-N-acetylglucosamine O-acyltransferase [Aliikangiella maris]|uniref:Acyl-[acyl-carrier-protein]--UDP-N-acetylglucosamine O-acyltransferase n=2 Tax=Aliikangiella maris TaxID=3162458 RepID=A0ABV3MMR5_9GAMM
MIHPSAVIHPSAKLADDVSVGAFSIIDENVQIDSGTVVGPHVVINGHTKIGKNNHFYQFSSIGEANQDKKYRGEPTLTTIGDGNIIREACTIHRGTVQDRGETTIGNNNLLMAYTHIAHDCVLGNDIVIANSSNLAGHVHVGDFAILGGFSGIHQFVHIGQHAFIGIRSTITQDIPPFVLFAEAAPRSINAEGLKRRGFSKDEIALLKRAYKVIYRQELKIEEAIAQLTQDAGESKSVQIMIDFIRASQRGIAR